MVLLIILFRSIVIYLVIHFNFASTGAREGKCPCKKNNSLNNTTTNITHICYDYLDLEPTSDKMYIPRQVIWNDILVYFTVITYSRAVSLPSNESCSVFIEITSSENLTEQKSWLCPGLCIDPLPRMKLPTSILATGSLHSDPLSGQRRISATKHFAITCSLTYDAVLKVFRSIRNQFIKSSNYYQLTETVRMELNWQTTVLIVGALRRLDECEENASLISTDLAAHPSKHSTNIVVTRRHILGAVIWTGNRDKYHHIEAQFQALDGIASVHGAEAVLGWAATEDLYPCRRDYTSCRRGGNYAFGGFLPRAVMNNRYYNDGYRCAQRRPLRALAHVLALFIPKFVVMLDDDSFFNYALFKQKYLDYVVEAGAASPMVWGESIGNKGDNGHISKLGFFVGGAGVILGEEVLRRLTSPRLRWFGHEIASSQLSMPHNDTIQLLHSLNVSTELYSVQQVMHLSLGAEALTRATRTCTRDGASVETHSPPCIDSTSVSAGFVDISVRAVDLCVALMAEERTCHQSDHSLTRCLLYAVDARLQQTYCHYRSSGQRGRGPSSVGGTTPSLEVSGRLVMGLCNMAATCDLGLHVVCHRYRLNVTQKDGKDVRAVVKTVTDKLAFRAYYRAHSSIVHDDGAVQEFY